MNEARLLLCDDEDMLRQLVRATLDAKNYAIVEARDGFEALEQARRTHPDVMLIDMMMPGRTGLELLKQVREDSELAATPVIMLSARTQKADRLAAVAAGADRYLAKPFSPRQLAKVVEEVLERSRRKAA